METKIWRHYKAGKQYQSAMGLTDTLPKCIDFKEGRQWPAATKATKHLPRPIFNYCEKFVRTKRSNILNQSIKMVYSPAEGQADDDLQQDFEERGAKAYSDFATALWKELGQDELNEDCIDDSATLGTGILHYYWDSSVTGGIRHPYAGALRGEVLDPLTVLFGDPQERDVQAQPYIQIAARVPVRAVRRMANDEGLPEEKVRLIVPDEETPDSYEASRRENKEDEKCTLITEYYKDGGVRYSRATKTVEIIVGRALTPGMGDKKPDEDRDENEQTNAMQLYPIAVMPWIKRKRSIYGIGEVEGMIPTQKAINWLMGMNILSAQDTAWPKMIVKPGALQQEITNTPGEIIEDHESNGDGIRYLNPPASSAGTAALVQNLEDMLSSVTGVNEVVSGEPFTATMAASAIIALQNQAKQPIESIQRRFYRVIESVGRIWEEFFKYYYDSPRPMMVEMANGEDGTVLFVGADFADVEFHLEIDVGAGSEYSESLAQATLDKLFDAGQIDLDTYVDLAPKSVMPFKESLKRKVEQQRQQQMMMGGVPTDPAQTAPMSDQQGGGRAPLGIPLPEGG